MCFLSTYVVRKLYKKRGRLGSGTNVIYAAIYVAHFGMHDKITFNHK